MDLKEKLDKRLQRIKEEKRRPLTPQQQQDRVEKWYFSTVMAILLVVFTAVPAYAAGGDPVATINNLSDFIFGAIRAIGIILLGFGLVQIGLSLKSHDASQRANGFMTFFGGIIIAFAKTILDLILG